MLRTAVVALLLLNVVLWAWQQGAIGWPLGGQAQTPREPQRLAQQLRPDSVRVLEPAAASAALAAASAAVAVAARAAVANARTAAAAPTRAASELDTRAVAPRTECLEAGPLTLAEAQAAEPALAALPAGSWARVPGEPAGGTFLVFTGRFPDNATKLRRLDELKAQGLEATEMRGIPALEPGILLGRYPTRAQAEAALSALEGRRVSPQPRVVPIGAPAPRFMLRVENADPTLRAQLAALAPPSPAFVPCAR